MCGIIIGKMNYYERAKYFRTKKRLGQNFLIDGQTISDIIDFADIKPDDTIIEIGPGVGFVIKGLLQLSWMKKQLRSLTSLMRQILQLFIMIS